MSKWIKVEDVLPAENVDVLSCIVTRYSNTKRIDSSIIILHRRDTSWWSRQDTHGYVTPEYWQPLPSPPSLTPKN